MMISKSRRQVSIFEATVIIVLAIVVTAIVTLWRSEVRQATAGLEVTSSGEEALFIVRSREELGPLASKYGPTHDSRYVEEWIIRDYFQDRREGVFLDVGANHYKHESNTYFLEKELGWSGIAVDALPEFGPDYVTHRPLTKFIALFASDVDDARVTLFEPEHHKRLASIDQEFTARKGERGVAREVPTVTLNRLLEAAKLERLDFVSMDIELAEPKALAGFNLQKYRPNLVGIEVHPEVRQQILDYFARGGYVLVGKYLRIDPTNVYFQPLSASTAITR